MIYLMVVASLFSQAALASTQKIHCKEGPNDFTFVIRNAQTTFSDDNDCFDSTSPSCRRFRQNVTGDQYDKIMELTTGTNLSTKLYARGLEGESVTIVIPNDRVAQPGAFKSRSQICAQDCVLTTFNCTSTVQ